MARADDARARHLPVGVDAGVATVVAAKRTGARAGLVFTRRSPVAPSVAVVARVLPDSIFAAHRGALEGREVVAVGGRPVRDPRHAAEIVARTRGEVRLTVRQGDGDEDGEEEEAAGRTGNVEHVEKEATSAAAASSERERLANEKEQTATVDRESGDVATASEGASTSLGVDGSENHRALGGSAVGGEERDRIVDYRGFHSPFVAGASSPFAAAAGGPRSAARSATAPPPRLPPHDAPRTTLNSEGQGEHGLAAGAAAGATTTAATSFERERAVNKDLIVAFARDNLLCASTPAESVGTSSHTSIGANGSENYRAHKKGAVRAEEGDGSDPFAAATDVPHPAAGKNRIGLQANLLTETWNQYFSKLEAYHASNGHCKVPRGYEADWLLGQWVRKQRTALKKGTLKPDQVARLNRIGFQANKQTEKWDENFSKLEAYHVSNGHCNVPRRYQANRALGQWVSDQRTALKKGTLKPDRVARLNRIGLQANLLTEKWNENFSKLEAYHASNGHCNVPRRYQADLALGRWLSDQRTAFENDTLEPDRAARLNRIGFRATLPAEPWNDYFSKLEAYHASNGHCDVPQRYQADLALGRWVHNQRTGFITGRLKPDWVARLNRIGFQANYRAETWNENFSKLEAYHVTNCHCNVPRGYQADRALGQWVHNQRTGLKKGTLKPDWVARLDTIGFRADHRDP